MSLVCLKLCSVFTCDLLMLCVQEDLLWILCTSWLDLILEENRKGRGGRKKGVPGNF